MLISVFRNRCRIHGRGPGSPPPIFRPEWGPKGRKNIFYLRVWMTGRDPAVVTGLSDLTHAYLPCTQLINWLVMTQLTHKKQSTRKQSGDIYYEHFESENGIMTTQKRLSILFLLHFPQLKISILDFASRPCSLWKPIDFQGDSERRRGFPFGRFFRF